MTNKWSLLVIPKHPPNTLPSICASAIVIISSTAYQSINTWKRNCGASHKKKQKQNQKPKNFLLSIIWCPPANSQTLPFHSQLSFWKSKAGTFPLLSLHPLNTLQSIFWSFQTFQMDLALVIRSNGHFSVIFFCYSVTLKVLFIWLPWVLSAAFGI